MPIPLPPSAIWDRIVDAPLVQDADYRFTPEDRSYIDSQIRGLETHIVQSLVGGVNGTWVTLDPSSAAVVQGDIVCLAGLQGGNVTKALPTPLAAAGMALGIVLQGAGPGSPIMIAMTGEVAPTASGLPPTGNQLFARVSSTGRVQTVASLGPTDYVVGTVDAAGNLTLSFQLPAASTGSALSPGTAGQMLFTDTTPAVAWKTVSGDVVSSSSTIGQLEVKGLWLNPIPAPTGIATQLTWNVGSSGVFSWQVGGGGGSIAGPDLDTDGTHDWVKAISGAGGTGGTVSLHIAKLQYDGSQATGTLEAVNNLTVNAGQSGTGQLTLTSNGTSPIVLQTVSGAGSIRFGINSVLTFQMFRDVGGAYFYWSDPTAKPFIYQVSPTTDAAINPLTIQAAAAWSGASTNVDGAMLRLTGGSAAVNGTTGRRGGVQLSIGIDFNEVLFEVGEIKAASGTAATNRRFTALNQLGSGITTAQAGTSPGDGATLICDARVIPGAQPIGATWLWSDPTTHQLWVYQSDGVNFPIAPASGGGGGPPTGVDVAGGSLSTVYVKSISGAGGGGGAVGLLNGAYLNAAATNPIIAVGGFTILSTAGIGATTTVLDSAGTQVQISIAHTPTALFTSTALFLENNIAGVLFPNTASPATIGFANAAGAVGNDLVLASEQATNQRSGHVRLNVWGPQGASSLESFARVERGLGNVVAQIGPVPSSSGTVGGAWLAPSVTPNSSNYTVQDDGTTAAVNGASAVSLRVGNAEQLGAINGAVFTDALVRGSTGPFTFDNRAVVLGGANVTLTGIQYTRPILICSGNVTSAIAIFFPRTIDRPTFWIVDMSQCTFAGGGAGVRFVVGTGATHVAPASLVSTPGVYVVYSDGNNGLWAVNMNA